MSLPSDPEQGASPIDEGAKYAPGTVLLEETTMRHRLRHGKDGNVILQPQPSTDPNDPLNWSMRRKIFNFIIIAFYALMVFAVLDIGPIVWQDYNEELDIAYTDLTNTVAANCAGLAVGCMIFIPFALKYGRRPVYIVTTLVVFICAIWAAVLRSLPSMLGNQIIAGLAGAVSETLVQMTVADVFFVHQRASMMAIYLLFLNTGGFAAPVAAGFIADSQGWPWIWWWSAIFLGVNLLFFIFAYEETKYVVLSAVGGRSLPPVDHNAIESDAVPVKDSKGATGDGNSLQITETTDQGIDLSIPRKTYWQRLALLTTTDGSLLDFVQHIYQPLILLCTIPAVAYTALQYGIALSWYSIIGTTESIYFSQDPYNFSTVGIGLLQMPPFIGCIISAVYSGPLSDWSIQWLAKRNNGVFEPEMRLYLILFPALAVPFGLFMYGYSVERGDHWIVPCIGAGIFAFGNSAIYGLSLTYLVDSYREIMGDALVAVALIRNSFAAAMTFAISPWIEVIGFYNTFTSVGCLSLAVTLLCVPMIVWGKKMRIACAGRYAYYAKKQFDTRRSI